VAPGTYACARCPANAIAPNAGPTAECTPCTRPLVANANATVCGFCPLLTRYNGTACAPCPGDLWCEGGKELACPYAGQCLGNLQGCRAGHAGFLCSGCVPRYYKAPSNFCEPCGTQLWQAAAWAAAFAAGAAVVALILPEQRKRVVNHLQEVYKRNRLATQMMVDHVTRLTNLNRLSQLSLPAGFKQALAITGVFIGFNTANAATECASSGGWAFSQKWGLTVGAVLGASLCTLLWDLHDFLLRGPSKRIRLERWRTWDAMDLIFIQAVQASWEAMAYVNVDGKNRLLSDPSTLFDEYPHFYIYCASVAIVVAHM
jgi:hypothetical protein